MYTDHIITPDEHETWFNRALAAPNGVYLIFEIEGRPVGFVSFTNIDNRNKTAVWAFYLGVTDVPRGSGSAMEFLALSHAFELLGVRKLCCEVFSFNSPVVKMHTRFGFKQEAHYVAHVRKGDSFEDVIGLAMFRDDWSLNKNTLRNSCFGVAKKPGKEVP
jgi:UDP-4-amino-4,6-dideoxy-N-acetyl-beta-L-altrosamine N-acetyltransferase